jgi:hypothetical protein
MFGGVMSLLYRSTSYVPLSDQPKEEPIFIIAHYQSVSENKILTTTHLIRKQVTQIAVTVPT